MHFDMNKLVPIVLFFSLYSLHNYAQNDSIIKNRDRSDFTVEEAQSIIDRYPLNEGSIVLRKVDSTSGKIIGLDPQKNKLYEKSKLANTKPMTKAEFEKSVAELAAYQQSEKGQIAKKMNDYFRAHKNPPPTDKQVDSLFKAIDKEFGTNWSQFSGPTPPGVKRFSSFDKKKKNKGKQ